MPPVILDRFPLPSLQAYTTVSVLILSVALYYAVQMTSDPEWSVKSPDNVNELDLDKGNETEPMENIKMFLNQLFLNDSITERLYKICFFIVEDTLCLWAVINMSYCTMMIIGKCIQKIVFGDLRSVEQQHMKDKFWNFVFYKFIFIFGVMNVHYMEEIFLWCGWFSFVGAFHLLSQLCKDRFEYLSFSPTTPKWTHLRLFALIFFILAVSISVCIVVALHANLSTFCFMSAEWALVGLRTLYTLIRYILHLYDVRQEGVWENRGLYAYYTELVFDLASLTVDFLHHLHMLFRGNILLSMATLVICMQLRCLVNEIQRKIIRHKNYLRVSKHMDRNYPVATKEELDANSDDCAICWDRMDSARKLPCGHMFHTSCLHSWLEQVTNCPTCRTPLVSGTPNADENRNILGQEDQAQPRQNQTTNHFFHFDGSRYISWFPSFSVEVSHTSLLGERQRLATHTSQLDAMVGQVLQMFPHLPYNLVMEDLLLTRSIEATVENIIEERLVPPVVFPNTSHIVTASINAPAPVGLFIVNRLGGPVHHPGVVLSAPTTQPEPGPSTSQASPRTPVTPEQSGAQNTNFQQPSQVDSETSFMRTGGEGCRFSKSSNEREKMLSQRKDELLRKARNKYIQSKFTLRDRPHSSTD